MTATDAEVAMIALTDEQIARAVREGREAADLWLAFRTPTTNEPVDRSLPAAAQRFFRSWPSEEDMKTFVAVFGTSGLAVRSRSAAPQAVEVGNTLAKLLQGAQQLFPGAAGPQALYIAAVLGWARRSMDASRPGPRREGR